MKPRHWQAQMTVRDKIRCSYFVGELLGRRRSLWKFFYQGHSHRASPLINRVHLLPMAHVLPSVALLLHINPMPHHPVELHYCSRAEVSNHPSPKT